jgi:ketosteroid isomerase-like protein
MTAKMIDAVRELERARFRAMVDADEEALTALLSERVSYVHTNGKRESKQQFIAALANGRRRYRQIEIESQEIVALGHETCVVSGRALLEMELKAGPLLFPIAYTAIHTQEAGRWQLFAWQATRCATE